MTRLYTLTGNLLAETTVEHRSVEWGKTHRAEAESFQVGGKGINVAKMASRLGIDSTAVCFPGGHSGERCLAWLKEQSFAVAGFQQSAETRSGLVVRAEDRETTFLGCDRQIEEGPWRSAIDFLESALKSGDILAICGSIPGWRESLAKPFCELLHRIDERIFIALDTYGPPLESLMKCPVDLVKVNHQEFLSVPPEHLRDSGIEEQLRGAAKIHPSVRLWVVTSGEKPVSALDAERRVIRLTPPKVKVLSPVGCGDVLLAGLLRSLVIDRATLEAGLGGAVQLAAANATSPGIADFDFSF